MPSHLLACLPFLVACQASRVGHSNMLIGSELVYIAIFLQPENITYVVEYVGVRMVFMIYC